MTMINAAISTATPTKMSVDATFALRDVEVSLISPILFIIAIADPDQSGVPFLASGSWAAADSSSTVA